jgi:membrane associated rhomboid family serine protease
MEFSLTKMFLGTGLFVILTPLTNFREYHTINHNIYSDLCKGIWDRSLITHMFSHQNNQHFIMNISNLVFSALYLDMGILKSCILYLGSGLSGLLSLYIHNNKKNAFERLIPVRVIGNSCCVYGFMGGEMCSCIQKLFLLFKKKYHRLEKHVKEYEIAHTLNVLLIRSIQLIYQLSTEGDEKIGHLGGFVGGALLYLLL